MSGSRSADSSHKRAGIKDIARVIGVSIGTVDRALHGRPGINPQTRQRVLLAAQSLNYHPNLAARYLKSKRPLIVHVNLPREVASFFDAVRAGISQASEAFGSATRVEFRTYPRLGEGDVKLFELAIAEHADGLIIAPGNPGEMKPLIRMAAQRQIPVVCVGTDAPGTERLTSVSADSCTNGAVVAELLCRFRPNGGPIAMVTGSLETFDHGEKLRGLKKTLQSMDSPISLVEILQARDDERRAFEGTKEILKKHLDLVGLYVSTANSLPVLRAVQKCARQKHLTIITTDLFASLVPFIRRGIVTATMYQRPISQGRLAFQSLYQFLSERKYPPAVIKLVPQIVMNSNLDLILKRGSLGFSLDEPV